MSEPFIGEIRMFAGNFAPIDWQMCNGQLLPISQYAALYAILGNIYGGDGRTNFALPDLRGRVPIHQGQGSGLSAHPIGQNGGVESVALTPNQMPSHTHLLAADGNANGKTTPIGNFPGAQLATGTLKPYSGGPPSGNMAAAAVAPAGGSTPVNLMQPFLSLNFIIATNGIFPTRE